MVITARNIATVIPFVELAAERDEIEHDRTVRRALEHRRSMRSLRAARLGR